MEECNVIQALGWQTPLLLLPSSPSPNLASHFNSHFGKCPLSLLKHSSLPGVTSSKTDHGEAAIPLADDPSIVLIKAPYAESGDGRGSKLPPTQRRVMFSQVLESYKWISSL